MAYADVRSWVTYGLGAEVPRRRALTRNGHRLVVLKPPDYPQYRVVYLRGPERGGRYETPRIHLASGRHRCHLAAGSKRGEEIRTRCRRYRDQGRQHHAL